MKFWELVSVCRSKPHLLERLADRPDWAQYLDWYHDFNRLVRTRDRTKLDAEIPEDACVHVLTELRMPYYEADTHIRLRRHNHTDKVRTAVDIYRRFGGTCLEDVNEFGLARIPYPRSS
jgi:hypothetical protein